MARYGIGQVGTIVTTAAAQWELRAPTVRLRVYEIGFFLTAATASTIGLGRPAAIGVGGGGVAPLGYDSAEAAATALAAVSWVTTAPTAPANYIRRAQLPAAIGNGMIWRWADNAPLIIPVAGSIVLWNLATNSLCNIYVEYDE
jgi:hypothetical protein